MKIKNLLAGVVATGALALGSQAAQAGIICPGCEYGDDAGTYLGSYNPTTFDFGTFDHSDVGIDEGPSTAFEDFWVFDLDPGGTGSISADLHGVHRHRRVSRCSLYADNGGTHCAGGDCSAIDLGALLAIATTSDSRWEIIADGLAAGRYMSPRHRHDVIADRAQSVHGPAGPSSSSRSRARLPCWDLASSVSA